MPTIDAYPFYDDGRRNLRVYLQGVCCQFRWNPTRHTRPTVQFAGCPHQERPSYIALLNITVVPSQKSVTAEWRDPGGDSGFVWVNKKAALPFPEADWCDLLTLARFVAAGRADKMMIPGWIEDNLPEPWCLLASPTPIEALRTLCPSMSPLSLTTERSDCETASCEQAPYSRKPSAPLGQIARELIDTTLASL